MPSSSGQQSEGNIPEAQNNLICLVTSNFISGTDVYPKPIAAVALALASITPVKTSSS